MSIFVKKDVDSYKYWNIIVNIRQRNTATRKEGRVKKKKEKKDCRITLIIDLELYKVDEDDVNELVSLYSDDFLYDLFKNDGNILNWNIKAEINRG